MINDKFETIHLIEKRIATHLFENAKEAYSYHHGQNKTTAKYLVIQSSIHLPHVIFKSAPICPVFIYNKKSYIFQEGQCLWNYFLARKQKDMVLAEQSIWKLLHQMCKCLIILRNNGYQHRHLKEYAIRIVNDNSFKLIYHPTMRSISEILQSPENRWNKFYLAPQQIHDHNNIQYNSALFSLGAIILNIMNPLDFSRDFYRRQNHEINKVIMDEKINNCKKFYSNKLIDIIRKTLVINFQERIGLQGLMDLIKGEDPHEKKIYMIESIKDKVMVVRQKSKEKSKQKDKAQQKESMEKIIDFQRGTFGGRAQVEQQEGPYQTLVTKRKVQTHIKHEINTSEITDNNLTNTKDYSKPYHQSTDLKYSQEPSLLRREDIHIQESESKELIQYKIQSFQAKLQAYQIQLAECLRKLSDIINSLGYNGIKIKQNMYYGQLIGGRRNGLALQIFPNQQYYYGYFKNDLFHGQGFYFWNITQYFLGKFDSGTKKEGTWTGKCKYVGQIKNNKREGFGWCIYPNGRIYEGQWTNGKFQGLGMISQPSGQKFVGVFQKGIKYGLGYYLADKCRISGIWQGDQTQQKVKITYENGNKYYGSIDKQFSKSGQGLFHFRNGVTCQGQFSEDEFIFGQIKYTNGQIYIGEVRQYRRNGSGKYYYSDGRIVEGLWSDNKLVSS